MYASRYEILSLLQLRVPWKNEVLLLEDESLTLRQRSGFLLQLLEVRIMSDDNLLRVRLCAWGSLLIWVKSSIGRNLGAWRIALGLNFAVFLLLFQERAGWLLTRSGLFNLLRLLDKIGLEFVDGVLVARFHGANGRSEVHFGRGKAHSLHDSRVVDFL